jgi:superoxide dismutase
MASIGIQPTMATPDAQPKIPPEHAKARAELYYSLSEHLPIDSPSQDYDPKKTVRYWFNEVRRSGANINTPFSKAQGDLLNDPRSLIKMAIAMHYPEALNLFLGIKGYDGAEPVPSDGNSLLAYAAMQGDENLLKTVHDFSHIRGATVHHFRCNSILANAITLSPYPVLHYGRFSEPEVQKRLIAWWKGTEPNFTPSETITVDYDGPIDAINFLLRQGANPRIPSDAEISPLEFITNPSPDDVEEFFFSERGIEFLRRESDGAFLFQQKIVGIGLPRRKLDLQVRHNFKQLALILGKATLDPNNQGGLREKADYEALLDKEMEEEANKARHDAHVKAYYAVNSVVSDVKLQAEAARQDAFEAKSQAEDIAESAQGAIEAHHAALAREALLTGIAINPIRRAFVYNISLCVQSLWECAKDQGNPTGIKTTRAKTKMDHVAGGVKALGSAIPGANVACSIIGHAIEAAIDGIERKKWTKIFQSSPIEGADKASVDIALNLYKTFELFFVELEKMDPSKGTQEAKELAIKIIQIFGAYLAKHEIDPRVGIVETLSNAPLANTAFKKHFIEKIAQVKRVTAARTAGATASKENLEPGQVRGAATVTPISGAVATPSSGSSTAQPSAKPKSPSFFERARKVFAS